ncbi:hypothetical protein [Deinococcus hohokamensis]|uniref:Uncharacterized protein n=1 Tax=Deinococcus hohokamensis TaxID=309883 RepID=A0ABV9IED3_9DEIO
MSRAEDLNVVLLDQGPREILSACWPGVHFVIADLEAVNHRQFAWWTS